jgi:hypothetical protein
MIVYHGTTHKNARRNRDRPIVLTCDIDIPNLRQRLGGRFA